VTASLGSIITAIVTPFDQQGNVDEGGFVELLDHLAANGSDGFVICGTTGEAATLSIYYLKSKQLRRAGILHGALPASIPIWGRYHPMMFPNWAVKFFADSLLLYEPHQMQVWQEQETWVKKCFELQLDGGGWSAHSTKLEPVDRLVCEFLQQELAVLPEGATVLDLGCGEGRHLNNLQTALPKLRFVGVDPCAPSDGSVIRPGSA